MRITSAAISIALGNLDPPATDQDGVEEELVLTTLNGDVVVFELAASGSKV